MAESRGTIAAEKHSSVVKRLEKKFTMRIVELEQVSISKRPFRAPVQSEIMSRTTHSAENDAVSYTDRAAKHR